MFVTMQHTAADTIIAAFSFFSLSVIWHKFALSRDYLPSSVLSCVLWVRFGVFSLGPLWLLCGNFLHLFCWFFWSGCQYRCNRVTGKTHLRNDLWWYMMFWPYAITPFTNTHSIIMNNCSERHKHSAPAVVRWSQKNFAPPQTPFPKAKDGQNVISWRWSLHSSTDPVSSYRGNRPTNKQTHKQTGPITIHCAAKLSTQCNKDIKKLSTAPSSDLCCRGRIWEAAGKPTVSFMHKRCCDSCYNFILMHSVYDRQLYAV